MYTHEPAGPGSERGCVGDTPTSSHSVPTAITVPGHLSHVAGLGSLLLPFLSPPETCLVPGGGWQKRRAGRRGANLHLLSPLSAASLASIPPPREPWEARSPSQQHHLPAAEARGLGRATPSRPESEAEHAHTLGLGTQHPGEREDWLCGTEVTNVFGLRNQAAGTAIGLPNSSLPSKTPTESLACAKHGRRVVNQTHSVPASPRPPPPGAGANRADRQMPRSRCTNEGGGVPKVKRSAAARLARRASVVRSGKAYPSS